jgi:hypothetical protein
MSMGDDMIGSSLPARGVARLNRLFVDRRQEILSACLLGDASFVACVMLASYAYRVFSPT